MTSLPRPKNTIRILGLCPSRDSIAFMRRALFACGEVELLGTSASVEDALARASDLVPDLVLVAFDQEMDFRALADGLAALDRIPFAVLCEGASAAPAILRCDANGLPASTVPLSPQQLLSIASAASRRPTLTGTRGDRDGALNRLLVSSKGFVDLVPLTEIVLFLLGCHASLRSDAQERGGRYRGNPVWTGGHHVAPSPRVAGRRVADLLRPRRHCARHRPLIVASNALPVAPRPFASELISSWLLRVAAANDAPLAELLDVVLSAAARRRVKRASLDHDVQTSTLSALSEACRVSPAEIRRLDLRHRLPYLRSTDLLEHLGYGPTDRALYQRVGYAFCPMCLRDTLSIHWTWCLSLSTRCSIHDLELLRECPCCGVEDPVDFDEPYRAHPRCHQCGALFEGYASSGGGAGADDIAFAYRESLKHCPTGGSLQRFVDDLLTVLSPCLNQRRPGRDLPLGLTRHDLMLVIGRLARLHPVRRTPGQARLWPILLAVVTREEGVWLDSQSRYWPEPLRRRLREARRSSPRTNRQATTGVAKRRLLAALLPTARLMRISRRARDVKTVHG